MAMKWWMYLRSALSSGAKCGKVPREKRLKRGFKVCAWKGGYLAVQSDDTW